MSVFLLLIHLANGKIETVQFKDYKIAASEAVYMMDHNKEVIAVEVFKGRKCLLSYGE